MKIEEAKSLGQNMKSIIRIGKKGITTGVIDEIDEILDKKDLVKIRILKNSPIQDLSELKSTIENKTIGRVVEIRGRTVLIINEEEL